MKYTATAPLAYRSRRKGGRSLAAYGSPTTRTITRQGSTRTDAYTYNNRSELISDIVDGTGLNGWDYDNIGNRRMEHRSDGYEIYTANQLNQYTAIEDQEGTFTPTYDLDGNQTRVKTSTGIWNVTYNAKNRPVLFTKDDNCVSVECTYDYMGRRATKKVTENGTVTLHQRYLYRGYLQIACCDLLRSNEPCFWLITWDPTQPIATRPLAIQKDGTWYTYGWDLAKNIWEAYTTTGYIGTAYTYTAYGQVTANGAVEQPIQWSSEYNDTELGLVYYNYRHYNSVDGRWLGRDIAIETQRHLFENCYDFVHNTPGFIYDYLGGWHPYLHRELALKSFDELQKEGRFANLKHPDKYRRALGQGATLPDMPVNTWKCLLPWNFAYRAYLTYSSHLGARQWWHAMNPGGLNPKQIRENIIELMLELKRKRQKKGIIDPIELGFALHIIADSYAHSHAQRDNRDRIVRYNNYKEQDAAIDHAPYDGFNDKAFKNMSKKEIENKLKRQNELYHKAQLATMKVMRALDDCNVTEAELKRLIEREIMPHAKNVK